MYHKFALITSYINGICAKLKDKENLATFITSSIDLSERGCACLVFLMTAAHPTYSASGVFLSFFPCRPVPYAVECAVAEQRRGINNPEFPAGVPIIRFQGPPILAESYVRRIYGPYSTPRPLPRRIHFGSPFLSLSPFQRSHDPLSSPDAPLFPPRSTSFLPSSWHPLRSRTANFASGSKQREAPTLANALSIFMAPKTVVHLPAKMP